MLFFGGYSSILPYLLYISVVWICILVGIRGNLWKIFKSEKISEQVLISDKSESGIENMYIVSFNDDSLADSENNIDSRITLPDHFKLLLSDPSLSTPIFTSIFTLSNKFSSQFLRGPPNYFP